MPKYKPLELVGNEKVQYASMADLCADPMCSRRFITAGDLIVKSNIDTFHYNCAIKWCNRYDISQTFRTQHVNELDLEGV